MRSRISVEKRSSGIYEGGGGYTIVSTAIVIRLGEVISLKKINKSNCMTIVKKIEIKLRFSRSIERLSNRIEITTDR